MLGDGRGDGRGVLSESEPNPGHWGEGVFFVVLGNAVGITFWLHVELGHPPPRAGWYDFVEPAMLLPSVTQLIWAIPLAIRMRRTGRRKTLMGMLVAMGIVLLLNAACFVPFRIHADLFEGDYTELDAPPAR